MCIVRGVGTGPADPAAASGLHETIEILTCYTAYAVLIIYAFNLLSSSEFSTVKVADLATNSSYIQDAMFDCQHFSISVSEFKSYLFLKF